MRPPLSPTADPVPPTLPDPENVACRSRRGRPTLRGAAVSAARDGVGLLPVSRPSGPRGCGSGSASSPQRRSLARRGCLRRRGARVCAALRSAGLLRFLTFGGKENYKGSGWPCDMPGCSPRGCGGSPRACTLTCPRGALRPLCPQLSGTFLCRGGREIFGCLGAFGPCGLWVPSDRALRSAPLRLRASHWGRTSRAPPRAAPTGG